MSDAPLPSILSINELEVKKRMKVIKWFDEHFEEFILIVFLVLISCITLLQVICHNVPAFPVLTWPEELCRFLWIATVPFVALYHPYRNDVESYCSCGHHAMESS